ncbi:MAG: hypothetical protein PHY92_05295 [Alphaproteobacteria bacterium]|nr:hypothetical protein [Alphaproteobacteria bacterium]
MQEIAQYTRAANAIIHIAEQGFFASLHEKTKEIVCSLMQSMGWVDLYVDALDKPQREWAVKNILRYLGGKETLAINDRLEVHQSLVVLKSILDESAETQKLEFLKKTEEVFDSGKTMSSTRNPRKYITEREREAASTADMILALASELGANKRFAVFLREAAIVGNLIDSIEDAQDDAACGKIVIKPSRLYFALAQKTLTHTLTLVKRHPQKRNAIGLGLTWLLRQMGLKTKVPWYANERHSEQETLACSARRDGRRLYVGRRAGAVVSKTAFKKAPVSIRIFCG